MSIFVVLERKQYGGAWCSLNQINAIPQEWLEIDFGNLTYLTQVETQGRFDNGRGKEYAGLLRLDVHASQRAGEQRTIVDGVQAEG